MLLAALELLACLFFEVEEAEALPAALSRSQRAMTVRSLGLESESVEQ